MAGVEVGGEQVLQRAAPLLIGDGPGHEGRRRQQQHEHLAADEAGEEQPLQEAVVAAADEPVADDARG